MKAENSMTERRHYRSRFTSWASGPLGSVVTATFATIGSFALVLSGIGAIHVALQ